MKEQKLLWKAEGVCEGCSNSSCGKQRGSAMDVVRVAVEN